MKKETLKEKINFYLDPAEFINKPRRVFMGLEFKLEEDKEITEKERDLIVRIIREASKDFYKHTLPKFSKEIDTLLTN